MRSELEIGRQLAFVLELIARGEALRVTVSKADSVTCNGPWHKEGVRVTVEGVRDHLPDQGDRLGGGFVTRERAVVGTPPLTTAGLMSLLVHVFCLLCLLCLLSEK